MLCSERSLVNTGEDWGVAIPLYCRSWGCPICQPRRREQLVALAKAGCPERFITLTASWSSAPSPTERAVRLAHAWRLICKRIRHRWPEQRQEFLAVFEATRRGSPHLHILQRGPYIPQRWLSDQMREIMGSPIVDIRQVKGVKQAARYVAKYLGKDPHRFGRCKRYWHTRDWDMREADDDTPDPWGRVDWRIEDIPMHQLYRDWHCAGLSPVITEAGPQDATGRIHPLILVYGVPPPSVRRWALPYAGDHE